MIGNARVITDNEKDCLALNVYHEGRSESTLGQFMIMDVVNNRSKSKNYPTNLCDVIKQPKQFSWYNNGWKPARNKKVLHVIRKNVDEFYIIIAKNEISKGAMWYHTKNVKPRWRNSLKYVATIENHIFYKK
ncbi:MAG: cell wall hydrolase [Candidatus Marinimicrobia bacterium]|nr:cell wall hydrolase [Candidatus Neomarinimicrobiota bacterium]